MLNALGLLVSLFVAPVAPGDSVVLPVQVTPAVQELAIDSVRMTACISGVHGSCQIVTKAPTSGSVAHFFAWQRILWAPNQTLDGTVKVEYGRVSPVCPSGMCWSQGTVKDPNWSFTLDARAPNAPTQSEIEVGPAALN
jgi:hypothetical protein